MSGRLGTKSRKVGLYFTLVEVDFVLPLHQNNLNFLGLNVL
jgi:hypothetical protein